MRLRTAATLVATTTLLVGVGIGVFIATPGLASALQQPEDGGSTPIARSSAPVVPQPSSSSTGTPTPGPVRADSHPLIGATDSIRITRAQLHAWAQSRPFAGQDPRNDAVWEQQQWLDITCMARKGFLDDPTNPRLAGHAVSEQDGLTATQANAYFVALWGPPTDAPYDWRAAGCHGRSVHLTGQDDTH